MGKDYPVDTRLAELGEQADRDSDSNHFQQAWDGYHKILEIMRHEYKEIDSFLMAKLTLGKLLTLLRMGRFEEAHQLWIADSESLDGLGIQFIESGQMSRFDSFLYMMMSAYLYSISAGDLGEAFQGMNARMEAICEYGLDERPDILPQALSNWHRFLQNVFSEPPYRGTPPEEAQVEFQQAIATFGQDLDLMPIGYPSPSPWVVNW
ncbi:MAG: hypothetical protein AAF685_10900 [Cyanobacteria bacterium P01_C01_bin.89]